MRSIWRLKTLKTYIPKRMGEKIIAEVRRETVKDFENDNFKDNGEEQNKS